MRFLTVAIFIFSSVCYLIAQTPPVIEEQKCLGGSSADIPNAIIKTSDGNFILAGHSLSADGDVSGNYGLQDYWIVKIDPDGNILWESNFGGSNIDYAKGIIETAGGDFIILGDTWSNDFDVATNNGQNDYWIVRIDESGNLISEKNFGGSEPEIASSISSTMDGGFIISGWSLSSDGDVSMHYDMSDYWVIKFAASGAMEWEKSLGGNELDHAHSVQQTTDGGYIIGGFSNSSDEDVSANYGESDYWIVKLDSGGNIEWEKNYGGSKIDECWDISQTLDGGYIATGRSNSEDIDVPGHYGTATTFDYWVLKLSSDGTIQWSKNFGGFEEDLSFSIIQDINSDFIIAGQSASDNIDVTANYGGSDFWLIKLDSAGNLLWEKNYGGTGFEGIQNFFLDDDTKLYCAAKTNSNDIDVSGLHGETDYWFIRLGCSIQEVFYSDNDDDGYGNPFDSTFACILPEGYAINNEDCNDVYDFIYPGAEESCNSTDDNCNGTIDDGLALYTFYEDADGDLYGNPLADTTSCLIAIPGFITIGMDCDDSNSSVYPGAEELPDSIDNDCDELIDEGIVEILTQENDLDLIIYPNPVSDKFFISETGDLSGLNAQIYLYSISGDLLFYFSGDITEAFELPESITSGVYFIRIQTFSKEKRFKVIVE